MKVARLPVIDINYVSKKTNKTALYLSVNRYEHKVFDYLLDNPKIDVEKGDSVCFQSYFNNLINCYI